MQKYARIVDDLAVDVVAGDPSELYHPAIAAEFVPVPDTVVTGSTFDPKTNTWSPPAPPVETPADEPATTSVIDVPTFLLRLLPQERVGIRASEDPLVIDFQRLLDDPRVTRINLALPAVQQAVGYLAGLGAGLSGQPLKPPLVDPSRVAAILAPEPVA